LTINRLFVGVSYLNAHLLEALIQQLAQVCWSTDRSYILAFSFSDMQICASAKWHARLAAIEFTQNMIFCNLFNARPYAKQLHELVFKCLFDEQFEVRTATLTTLSGLYQCGYFKVTDEDLVG
jgi:hypothetical protein